MKRKQIPETIENNFKPMIIYRAMCEEEYNRTIKYKVPHFIKRYKWFSTNLDFILTRVKDGKFNNSQYKENMYSYILEFEWDGKNADWINSNEIQFDRRKNPNIKLIKDIK